MSLKNKTINNSPTATNYPIKKKRFNRIFTQIRYGLLPRHLRHILYNRKQIGLPIFAKWNDFFYDSTSLALQRIKHFSNFNSIENLILGPCYGRYDWVNTEYDLNLATGGEDLYRCWKIYSSMIEKCANLKNIILFYGTFYPGFDVEFTGHVLTAVAQKVLWQIPYKNPDQMLGLGLCDYEKLIEKDYFKILKNIKNLNYEYENLKRKKMPSLEEVKSIALGHYKNNQRTNKENQYLKLIIKDALIRNINMTIIIPPYTEVYRKWIPESEELFHSLFDIKKEFKKIEILNLYDAQDFDEEKDFTDYEHMNFSGAKKLTKIVKKKFKIK